MTAGTCGIDAADPPGENGAYLSWEEKIKGTLEPGKLADMIVLDSDPLTIDPAKIMEMKVDMTILGGKLVYERAKP